MKTSFLICSLILLSLSCLPAQYLNAEEGDSFRFPGGDVEAGAEAFVSLDCVKCHTVAEANLSEPEGERLLHLKLGAHGRFVKRYEDLILAIVNPRHVVSEQYRAILTESERSGGIEALMPDLTKEMSARQLIDLVAFLNQAYKGSLDGYGE
ncbi:MAG: hypothetical protein P1U68_11160 [Verrucomicrobiales bacterium]|nr:hypothetical protein [Verrucomicrobiales bacterium]